ncbi:MAG: DUF3810 domain-containing protein [Ruminococcus sp.]|nr:DUF3810 domain-containing protein [Ruminococcus sp.]
MKLAKSTWVMFGIWGVLAFLNVLARCSRAFSDWYVMNIFPHFSTFWARFTGAFPFSVGELLIVLAVIVGVPAIIAFPCFMIFAKAHRGMVARIYGKTIGWILTWVFTVLTLHFFILYQCTPFGDKYYPNAPQNYSADEVRAVLSQMIMEANKTAELVSRDEKGQFIISEEDLQAEAKKSMQRLGEKYPQYAGFYPDAKGIFWSDVMTKQWILGIYYPFSMEANYNTNMCPINLPNTLCHEYTHLKGNIFEDEAGFLAFLACMQSDSADFRYSGYVQALEYVMDVAWDVDPEGVITSQLSEEVWADMYCFVPEEYWEEHEDDIEIIPDEVVEEVADVVMDTSLKVNGIEDGSLSYGRMVDLILDYYIQENKLAQKEGTE